MQPAFPTPKLPPTTHPPSPGLASQRLARKPSPPPRPGPQGAKTRIRPAHWLSPICDDVRGRGRAVRLVCDARVLMHNPSRTYMWWVAVFVSTDAPEELQDENKINECQWE
ncbi:hypothetical protein BKA56DRAFT_607736 [Ilyonectria sp. MPI-CAGE-AT-0026]|nr:hypothetical protein BKA56DRAFT_607736 [Ilyonectria sp. MPI-CAGE-AT-0026]